MAPNTKRSATDQLGGVLVDIEIRHWVRTAKLIEDFDESSLEGASYDMRLGPQYVRHGIVETLTDERPTLLLEAGEFALLRSFEQLNMPLTLVGHNGIMSPWAKRGLVSLFSPQIDPGFCGFLVVPVFNAGDAPISITLKQRIFTVEFVATSGPASYGWSDRHGRQDRFEVPVTPAQIRPNLSDIAGLQKDVGSLKSSLSMLEQRHASVSADIRALETIVGDKKDRRSYRITKWTFLLTIASLALGLILGILGSDWLRERVIKLFH